jgi:hypothetical protein
MTTTRLKRYRISEEESGAEKVIQAESLDAAIGEARAWCATGVYPRRVMVGIEAVELDAHGDPIGDTFYDEVEAGPEAQPEPSACGDADTDHDWQRPHTVVGGLTENPGVWAMGGTAIGYLSVCARCGQYKREHHTGSQREPGDLPVTIQYEPGDEVSLAWVREQAE